MAEFQRESKTFSQVLDFTRPDPGTYYDSAGALQTAAVDEPRFTHDPVTGDPEGLLIEEQRPNLFLQSEDFSQEWINLGSTFSSTSVSPNSSPIFGVNFQRVSVDSTVASEALLIVQVPTTTIGQSYSLSFIVGKDYNNLRYVQTDTGNSNRSMFDIDTGTFVTVHPAVTATSVKDLGSAWLVSLAFPADETSERVGVMPTSASNISYSKSYTAGDYAEFIALQLEPGSTPSSYIKTEASQVTRSADSCTRTLGSEYNNSDFTVYCNFDWDGQGSGSRYLWAISQGANNSQTRLALRVNVNSQRVEAIVSVGGTITLVTPVPEFIAQIGSNTAALSLSSSGDIVIAVNGQTETLSDPGTFGSANLLTVGSLPGGQSVWNGPVPLIKMEPRANTEEFLAEATA